VSSSLSDVDRCVVIRNLLDSILNMHPVYIGQWEIQTYIHMTFLP
jgi:hypothetical protein